MHLGIGSKIWVYDENKRVYVDDAGNKTNSPNPRHYWRECEIVGENKTSWIAGYHDEIKINKKTLASRHQIAYSLDEIERWLFVHYHRFALIDALRYCTDCDKLKAIAKILEVER